MRGSFRRKKRKKKVVWWLVGWLQVAIEYLRVHTLDVMFIRKNIVHLNCSLPGVIFKMT